MPIAPWLYFNIFWYAHELQNFSENYSMRYYTVVYYCLVIFGRQNTLATTVSNNNVVVTALRCSSSFLSRRLTFNTISVGRPFRNGLKKTTIIIIICRYTIMCYIGAHTYTYIYIHARIRTHYMHTRWTRRFIKRDLSSISPLYPNRVYTCPMINRLLINVDCHNV
jgi:hypothetical protein